MEKERVRLKFSRIDEPKLAKVSILNNDKTEYQIVVAVVMAVFNKSIREADRICKKAHTTGSGYIGVYTRELADTMVEMAKAANSDLEFDVEEA